MNETLDHLGVWSLRVGHPPSSSLLPPNSHHWNHRHQHPHSPGQMAWRKRISSANRINSHYFAVAPIINLIHGLRPLIYLRVHFRSYWPRQRPYSLENCIQNKRSLVLRFGGVGSSEIQLNSERARLNSSWCGRKGKCSGNIYWDLD